MFFRWRPAHFGAEIYWNGILDHDDIPRRRFEETQHFGRDIKRIEPHLLGTSVRMEVAVAGSDFDNQEIHKTYPLGMPTPHDAGTVLHAWCYDRHIACGFVHPEDDLSRIKVLFVPHWLIWKDEWTPRVEAFVRAGGTVLFGARTGSRDKNNHVIRAPAPGTSLSQLCGVTVEEFGPLPPEGALGLSETVRRGEGLISLPNRPAESSRRLHSLTLGNRSITAAHAYEHLTATEGGDGIEIVSCWNARFAAEKAAITLRRLGEGRVLYVGTYLTPDLIDTLFATVLADLDVEPLLPEPQDGIEVSLREAEGRALLFILNTRSEPSTVKGVPRGTDLLEDHAIVDGNLELGPQGCAVIRLGDDR